MSIRRIRQAGDSAIVVELGEGIDAQVNARAVALATVLRAGAPAGVRDVIATFRSVAVFFDALRTDLPALVAHLQSLARDARGAGEGALVEIPVEYGGDAGPDLDAVAATAGLPADEIVSRHTAREYRVFMVGFLPGFAYLGPVDDAIAAGRRASPRVRVPAGSVGIGGRQYEGVPVSGAMDRPSLERANAAAGNTVAAAALEVTLGGAELRLEHAGTVVVTGADLGATLDGQSMPLEAPLDHAAGSVVRFTERRRGTRAYLGVGGGLAVEPVLGSRATDLTSGFGGLAGRRLRAGDRVPVGASSRLGPPSTWRPPSGDPLRPLPTGGARVRVLPGPHDEWFPPAALERLCRTRYEVTPESNRMGYRLRGAEPLPREAGDMVSDATCEGGLQVPPSGQPILLMADRQVTGGYPIIATVITADLPVIGQLAPGDWIEFDACTRADALAALAGLEGGTSGG